jgi:uncharacterized protein (TIGR03083 family)
VDRRLVLDAFGAEASRLAEMTAAASQASYEQASPCPPWSVAELLAHVLIGVSRVPGMLAKSVPADGPLVSAAGYYQPGRRFSVATNAEKVGAAQRAAAALGSGPAVACDFDRPLRRVWSLARDAPQDRLVCTRHGDRMLLTDFLRARVLELAVHGLDLAAGLGRPAWMTAAAADVLQELVLPRSVTATLLAESGWDQITLIAKATGRLPLAPAELGLIRRLGGRLLALG